MKSKTNILLCLLVFALLVGCGNKNADPAETQPDTKPTSESTDKPDTVPIKISTMRGQFSIDPYSYAELAGDADYVIIGKVLEETKTEYLFPVEKENEDGSVTVSTIPYTNFSVQVVENIKGSLNQAEPIIIRKCGGVTENGDCISLYENDILPVPENTYVFYIYAQADGTNVVEGPNSTILLEGTNDGISTRTAANETETDILEQIKQGVENQIVTDRQRSVSNNETAN